MMSTDALTSRLDRPETQHRPIEPAQRTAAKVVGFFYLFTMATAIFGETYVRGRMLVPGDAVQTAKNIAASERLFRIGVVADLITVVGVIALLWGLYVILSPINKNVALLAAFLRLAENAIAAAGLISVFSALRLLAGTSYLQVFETEQLQVLARVFIGGQGAGLQIAFVFLGFGSAVFSCLWFQSRYIPRALAVWGVFSSLLLALVGMTIMIFPALGGALGLTYMVPMFIYEVGLGLWLLIKGLRLPRDAERPSH